MVYSKQKTKSMDAKRIVKFFAVFLIILSVFFLYSNLVYLFKVLPLLPNQVIKTQFTSNSNTATFRIEPNIDFVIFSIKFASGILLSFLLYLICGIGLLSLRKWARRLLLIILDLFCINLLLSILLFGFMAIKMWYFLWGRLILIVAGLWILNSSTFMEIFQLSEEERKKERKANQISLIAIVVCLLICIVFSSSYFYINRKKADGNFSYHPKKILISTPKIQKNNCVERQLGILKLKLSKDVKNTTFGKSLFGSDGYGLLFKDNNNVFSLLLCINDNSLNLLKPFSTLLGFDSINTYELFRKYIREKVGIIVLIAKSIGPEKGRYDEVESDTWKGFVSLFRTKVDYRCIYTIFTKKSNIPYELVFFLGKNQEFKSNMEDMLASLDFSDGSVNTPKILFTKGLEQLKNGSAEEAKYSFINCLLQDYKNPIYHLYLAKAYKETGCLSAAKSHLEQCLEFDSNNVQAKEMLKAIIEENKATR